MKVIFLDIDGVLNTRSYREEADYPENPISEFHLCLLEYLVKRTDAKIVLSSSWRMYWERGKVSNDPFKEYIDSIFGRYGLEIFDKTPFLQDRDDEISAWLKQYQGRIESFVIIDDFDFEWSEESERCLVRTSDESGLDERAVERAIEILNSNREV